MYLKPRVYYKTTPDFTYNAIGANRRATDNWIYASPVVDSNGTIYVCTNKGMVHAVSSSSKSAKWKNVCGEITPLLRWLQRLVSDFVVSNQGERIDSNSKLYALDTDNLGSALWQNPPMLVGKVPGSLVLYHDRIYLGTTKEICMR